jgi:AcrR family transcriptional regulator
MDDRYPWLVPPRGRSPEEQEALRASLVAVALEIVHRDGPGALTMRSLASEAGCSVGLPYKVFDDRAELVAEVIGAEFTRLREGLDGVVAAAGTRTVGTNLARWASLLLDSPAIGLVEEVGDEDQQAHAVEVAADVSGIVPVLEHSMVDYLRAEQQRGRVAADVDVEAFGFVIAGAIHNLLMYAEPYPRPTDRQLRRMLRSIAATLAPRD